MNGIAITDYSKKKYLIRLLDFSNRTKLDKIITNLGGSWVDSELEPGWIFPKDNIDDLKDAIKSAENKREKHKNSRLKHKELHSISSERSNVNSRSRGSKNKHNSERSRSHLSESSSDTDDELIQKALARRIVSESSHKSIEDMTIDNSDNEDCVSFSRRLRHLYIVIDKLSKKIELLESKVH